MTSSLEWLHVLILHYPAFQFIIIFLGAAFGGELALFTISFLAAQGILHIFPLVVFSFFGAFSADILWFSLGRTSLAEKIISHRYASPTISIITQAVDRVSKGNRLVALIFAKFLVGTRIVLIMYVSRTDLALKRFARLDAIAVLVWLLLVIPIGFISGLGFTYLAEFFHNLYIEIGLILLILFIVVIIQIWLEKVFIKKEINKKSE